MAHAPEGHNCYTENHDDDEPSRRGVTTRQVFPVTIGVFDLLA